MDAALKADVDRVGKVEAVPKILDAVRRMTGMRLSAVARVTHGDWVACAVSDATGTGLAAGDTLDIDRTLCRQVHATGEPVVVDHASRDPGFADHPLLTEFGFESGFSFPIVLRDGSFFGALCAFDPDPRALRGTPSMEVFALFAELIAAQIGDTLRLDETRRILDGEKANAELREQFIAVLGHDLRNPVASIVSGTRMLGEMPLGHNALTIVKLMQGSAARMNGLIDTLLDFARGRVGDGLTIMRSTDVPLRPVLDRTIEELRATSHHVITAHFDFDDPVHCDTARIGQLLANLVDNAIVHGADDIPVRVRAWREDGLFHLDVTNGGDPIPDAMQAELFEPFSRSRRDGLGLGLYIAAEIARRHKGEITCVSTPEETRFTLTMAA